MGGDATVCQHVLHISAGDYWPGEAEAVLANYEEQQRQAGRNRQGGSASGKARSKQSAKVIMAVCDMHVWSPLPASV